MPDKRHGNLDVLREVDPHWYKLAAILAHQLLQAAGKDVRTPIVITTGDILRFINMFPGDEPAIIYHPKGDEITIQLMPYKEALEKHAR